jgi:hypothetical protein
MLDAMRPDESPYVQQHTPGTTPPKNADAFSRALKVTTHSFLLKKAGRSGGGVSGLVGEVLRGGG